MHQEKVSVEVGKAIPQLNQYGLKVWRFRQDVTSFIQRTKGKESFFKWQYAGLQFTVVLSAIDKFAWKVFRMICETQIRKVKTRRSVTRRMYKNEASRNHHHRNPIAAFSSYA